MGNDMKKIIKEIDEKLGIVQVTIADERWYLKSIENPVTGIPEWIGKPSVTWIAGCYPKGIGYYKWLAEHGWDEAEAIKVAAGEKGSKVHKAIEDIIHGNEVRIDSKYLNPTTGYEDELTLEECDAILPFVTWFKEVKPETIAVEKTVFSETHNYAGTVDYLCKIGEEYWIIDFKTSQQVFKSHEIQISAYKKALESGENPVFFDGKQLDVSNLKMAILQVGYRKNRAGYKVTPIEDQFDLFLTAQKIWKEEHEGETPNKKDYPIVLWEGAKKESFEVSDEEIIEVPKEEGGVVEIKKTRKVKK